jgi:hypothetical protein
MMFAEAPVEALPLRPEAPRRERLRKEKELLGLYLSEHPMGEVAEQVGAFVTAYSADLKDESLDGERVVVAGIVTGFRTIVTKSKSTMGVATLEDLQGTVEVVVFPKLYEQTPGTWTEGTILLVVGRIDHRGEEVSILADLVTDWDGALARGPEAFAREVAAGDRGRGPRRSSTAGSGTSGRAIGASTAVVGVSGANGNGNVHAYGNGNGNGNGEQGHAAGVPVMAPTPDAAGDGRRIVGTTAGGRAIPYVSPLRADAAALPSAVTSAVLAAPVAPAAPVPTYHEPPGLERMAPDQDDEPALPDEAQRRVLADAAASTAPQDAAADAVLHVRFAANAGTDRVVGAMEAFKGLLVERPGSTKVVLHVPAPTGGASLPMELRRGVAYDADLLAEVRRRLGEGTVELNLG